MECCGQFGEMKIVPIRHFRRFQLKLVFPGGNQLKTSKPVSMRMFHEALTTFPLKYWCFSKESGLDELISTKPFGLSNFK
jgi:hypothetical protein